MKKTKKESLQKVVARYLSIAKWAIGLQIRAAGFWYILYLAKKLFDQMRSIIQSFLTGLMLNTLADALQSKFTIESQQEIYRYLLYFLVFQLFIQFVNVFAPYLERFIIRVRTRMEFKNQLLQKIIDLDWPSIENSEAEKRIRISFTDGLDSVMAFVNLQVQFITVFISIVLTVVFTKLPPFVVLITLLGAIPQGFVNMKYFRRSNRVYETNQPLETKASGLLGFFRQFSTLFEAKISNIAPALKEKHISLWEQSYINQGQVEKSFFKWDFMLVFINLGIDVSMFLYFLQEVIAGKINIGTFQFIVGAVNTLRWYTASIFDQISYASNEYRYLRYTFEFLTAEPTLRAGEIEFDGNFSTLEFKNVWFKYPKSKKWALKDISTTINNKERIALVGENGAGKSTFVKILLRAYDITKGEILLNGIPIQKYSLSSLYKNLAVITQDFSRFDVLSIKENIGIANLENLDNIDAIKEAAHLAEADKFIENLKQKYNTILSKRIENGTELSSGQWQKIALARLFFADKPIVLLDEPTASIDPVSEHRIFQNIYQKLKEKTVILVSHRYNTVKEASKILVFNEGKIIEEGTHTELLARKGYYEHAYSLQNEGKTL